LVCQWSAKLPKHDHKRPISAILTQAQRPIKMHTKQLGITQIKRLFETAKPLFIGSIPIAAFPFILNNLHFFKLSASCHFIEILYSQDIDLTQVFTTV
jgi:hypothetical protein